MVISEGSRRGRPGLDIDGMGTLTLGDETWGDRVHRAYRVARQRSNGQRDPLTGRATFSYLTVAEKLTATGFPVSDTALLRLEEHRTIPTRATTRRIAYFAILGYGFDPADFGLTADTVDLSGFDVPRIRRMLTAGGR